MGSAGFGWSGDKDFLGGGEADWFTPLPDTPEPNPVTKREKSIQIETFLKNFRCLRPFTKINTHNKHCELN